MAKIRSNLDSRLPPRSKAGKTALIRPEELGSKKMKPHMTSRKVKELGVQAVRKQVPLTRRIARSLLNEESRDIGSYILYDILIPAAKSMITESIQSGIEMLIYGEAGQRQRPSRSRGGPTVSYGSFYQRQDRREDRPQKRFSNARFNLDEIIFKNGSDCSDVLAALCDHIEEYEQVSVAEFYDYAGVEGATWTDHKWGWTGSELSDAYCTHTRGGYIIVLPEPKELE
jgi:hypothetical protein